MGVLDIRMRSQSLGNVGGIPRIASVDYSSVAAIRNQTERQKAQRLAQGIGNLGDDANKAFGIGVGLYKEAQSREDDRVVTNAANEIQKRYDAYMNGNGEGNSGAWNAPFEDGREWMTGNDHQYDLIESDVFGSDKSAGGMNLNERQQELVRRHLAGYRRNWMNQQANKANAVYNRNEMAGATEGTKNAERTLLLGYNETAWGDWRDAVKRELAVNQRQGKIRTPEEVEAFWRERGGRVMQNETARRLKEYAAEVSTDEDSKSVGEFYDKKIKELEKDPLSLIPKDDTLRNALGPDAEGIGKLFVTSLKSAKKTAMHNADYLRNAKTREVSYDSQNAETDMILGNGWEDMPAESKADAYRRHLASPSGKTDSDGNPLTWEQAYKIYSPVRGKTIQRTIDTYAKAAKADVKKQADADWKRREEELVVALTQPFVYQTDEQGNLVYDPSGAPMVEPLTPQRRMEMAFDLWQDKGDGRRTISEASRNRIVSANRIEFNENAKQVCQEVLRDVGIRYPKAVAFRAKDGADGTGEFYIKTDSHVKTPSQTAKSDLHNFTGDWSWYRDDAEDVAYSDCATAMNLTMQWMDRNKDASVEDGKKYFRSILEGKDTEGRYRRMKMEEHFADEQRKLGILEGNFRAAPTAANSFSLGVSPRGTIRPVSTNAKKETK